MNSGGLQVHKKIKKANKKGRAQFSISASNYKKIVKVNQGQKDYPNIKSVNNTVTSINNTISTNISNNITPSKKTLLVNNYSFLHQNVKARISTNQESSNKHQDQSSGLACQKKKLETVPNALIFKNDESGHTDFQYKQLINQKYEVRTVLGKGTFGKCYEVVCKQTGQTYAMKCIKRNQRYTVQALQEAEMLETLHKNNPQLKSIKHYKARIVKIYEHFKFQNSYCIVFEKLGPSLYDYLKKRDFEGFTIDLIQQFLKQILEGLVYLHSSKLTHTDLKPENILLEDEKRKKLKIIDFGSATWDDEHHSSLINTRQYRAPEVMMQFQRWNKKSDIWSIGCIVMEMITGKLIISSQGRLYFETNDDYEHMALISKHSEPITSKRSHNTKTNGIQGYLLTTANNKTLQNIKTDFKIQKNLYYGYNDLNALYQFDTKLKKSSIDKLTKFRSFRQIINDVQQNCSNSEKKKFNRLVSLLEEMFEIDPYYRITAEEALKHVFFSN